MFLFVAVLRRGAKVFQASPIRMRPRPTTQIVTGNPFCTSHGNPFRNGGKHGLMRAALTKQPTKRRHNVAARKNRPVAGQALWDSAR